MISFFQVCFQQDQSLFSLLQALALELWVGGGQTEGAVLLLKGSDMDPVHTANVTMM